MPFNFWETTHRSLSSATFAQKGSSLTTHWRCTSKAKLVIRTTWRNNWMVRSIRKKRMCWKIRMTTSSITTTIQRSIKSSLTSLWPKRLLGSRNWFQLSLVTPTTKSRRRKTFPTTWWRKCWPRTSNSMLVKRCPHRSPKIWATRMSKDHTPSWKFLGSRTKNDCCWIPNICASVCFLYSSRFLKRMRDLGSKLRNCRRNRKSSSWQMSFKRRKTSKSILWQRLRR